MIPPSGTVTFLFTDVEGSTRLMRSLGDRYEEAANHHFELLRGAFAGEAGYLVGPPAGDSMLAAFSDADAALRAAAAAQRGLGSADWPDGLPLRARMGLHTGLAAPRAGTYVSIAVNQAARVMSAAHGGQVLVSADTAAASPPPPGLSLAPLGSYRVRDFEEPLRLFQLGGPGLAEIFPAVRALPAGRHNLVTPPGPLIGRSDSVAQVRALLAPGRIVTLAGPGGVGKTRLANEIGRAGASDWDDGVWLVELAPVDDPALTGAAVAASIGVPARGGERWDEVVEHLRGKSILLIVDNCEHLRVPIASCLVRLVSECPGCAVLATSREPLDVGYEVVQRVSPLAVPRDGAGEKEIADAPAVQLLLERGRAAGNEIAGSEVDYRAAASICERLDGLPLAIEMAAVQLRRMQPAELLEALRDGFGLLVARDPLVSERQRTLDAALSWGEGLLTDDERTCVHRLSLFRGSFSSEAAAACVAGQGIEPMQVRHLVWSLVDKSLVFADPRRTGTRYRLLETVRHFSARQLVRDGQGPQVAIRLAAWYLEQVGPESRHQPGWTAAVAAELDNLRALVPLVAGDAPESAQRIAVLIGRYLDSTQSYGEAIEQLGSYIEELPQPTPTRISMLTTMADLHLRLGDAGGAGRALAMAEELSALIGSPPDWDDVAVDRSRGDLACRTGDNAHAADWARAALNRPLSVRGRARMSNQLGIALSALGDLEGAAEAFASEAESYRELGDLLFEASAEGNLAETTLRMGDVARAAAHQRTCLHLALELGMPVMLAFSLIVAARIAALRGQWDPAVRLHSQAETILDQTGIALYAEDRHASEAMLAAARRALPSDEFDAAAEQGGAGSPADAAGLAEQILGEDT